VEVYAKAEWANPGGSIKDRAALRMIQEGEVSGALAPGKIIIDASSGNTGLAYAMFGAAFGYAVRVVMPGNVSLARLRLIRDQGAEVITTDPMDGMDGAIEEARRLVQESPEQFFYPDQYNNPANWRAHYYGTAREILSQTGGRVTHFIAGLGTTGTFVGTGRRFREFNPRIELSTIQPDSPLHALEGLKHLETTRHVPAIFDQGLVAGEETVSTEEARAEAFRLAREEGIFLGPSAGAAAVGARRVANRLSRGVVVTVFPDAADRYLEEPFWER
jgi:cysteine synthase B